MLDTKFCTTYFMIACMFSSVSTSIESWNPFSHLYDPEQYEVYWNPFARSGRQENDRELNGMICKESESDEADGIETTVKYETPDTGRHFHASAGNYCQLHSPYGNHFRALEISYNHKQSGADSTRTPSQNNISLNRGVKGYEFSEVIDGFQFHLTKSSTRTHIVADLEPGKSYFRAFFILPDVAVNDFAYLQVWYIMSKDDVVTSEIGLKKWQGDDFWSPLVFNTDDGHSTGWFGDRHIQWPRSVKRTRDLSDKKHMYKNGNEIKLTTAFKDGTTELWINSEYIGSVEMQYRVDRLEFGFEQDRYGRCKKFIVKSMKQW